MIIKPPTQGNLLNWGFSMSTELQCYVLLFQARSLTLQRLLQAERIKEYDAEWLDNNQTINRDQGGRFAKKIDNLENYRSKSIFFLVNISISTKKLGTSCFILLITTFSPSLYS